MLSEQDETYNRVLSLRNQLNNRNSRSITRFRMYQR